MMPTPSMASMAFTMGDKLKASAGEIMRGIEAWKAEQLQQQQEESIPQAANYLESALQKMFGSCTAGTGEIKCEGEDPLFIPSTTNRGEQGQHRGGLSKKPATLEHYRSVPKSEYGEHIYEQLFLDDSKKTSLRAPDSARDMEPPSPRANVGATRVFPASSPGHQTPAAPQVVTPAKPPSPILRVEAPPLGSNELVVVHNQDFDDTISAVSAYTLEAMAHAEKLKPTLSTDSSLFPSSTTTPRQPSPISQDRSFPLGRKPSQHTHETSNMTQDSDDEHVEWMTKERDFWEQEAWSPTHSKYGRPCKPIRAKSLGSRRSHDPTVSTSSHGSSFAPHQHDIFPYDACDFIAAESDGFLDHDTAFRRDPDRIDQVLLLPVDTEIAEI